MKTTLLLYKDKLQIISSALEQHSKIMEICLQQSSYVLHSFSARSALVKLWRTTSAERVIIVHSTKQKGGTSED